MQNTKYNRCGKKCRGS